MLLLFGRGLLLGRGEVGRLVWGRLAGPLWLGGFIASTFTKKKKFLSSEVDCFSVLLACFSLYCRGVESWRV